MTIRAASHGDIDVLAELLGSLFSQEPEFAADQAKQMVGLKLILDDAAVGCILVACQAENIVGMVNLLFTVSTALGKRVAILDDLIVRAEQRGKGVGKALMDAAIDYCAEHGFARISLQTDVDNYHAQHMYASRGFIRSTMISYRKMIPYRKIL